MATAIQWLQRAEEQRQGAEMLDASAMSAPAASRWYYAAHNAGQGICQQLEPASMPRRGNWSHGRLPGEVWHAAGSIRMSAWKRDELRLLLIDAYNIRVEADYRPDLELTRAQLILTRRAAQEFVWLLRSLCHD